MTDSYRVAPERTIELRTLMAEPLAVYLREVTIEVEPGGSLSSPTSSSPATPTRAASTRVSSASTRRDAGRDPSPSSVRPIRVVARLRSHLADLLARSEDPMAALIEHLLAPPAELAHADAWRAIDVTQEDANVAGLSMGYRTVWAGPHNLD